MGTFFLDWTLAASAQAIEAKLAFHSNRNGANGSGVIYIMGADGSSLTRITNDESTQSWSPSWSPDGARITFSSSRDGRNQIYVIGVDGSNPTRLTVNPASDYNPAWSPDGTKIAFTRRAVGNSDIYVIDVDGSNPTRWIGRISPGFARRESIESVGVARICSRASGAGQGRREFYSLA
jgi:dipeptidyl aminopeptidase/acylaminoacyl peptidase